MNDSLKEQL